MKEFNSKDLDALLAHGPWVAQLALRLTGNEHEAQDLAQDAWVAALRKRPALGSGLRPWLAEVLHNLARDGQRRRASRRWREENAQAHEAAEPAEELLARAALHRELVDAVLKLAEPYRNAILMRYLEESTPAAIAVQLDIPLNTVNTRLARGLVLLRARLDRSQGKRSAWVGIVLAGQPRPRLLTPRHLLEILTTTMKTKSIQLGTALLLVSFILLGFFAALKPEIKRPLASASPIPDAVGAQPRQSAHDLNRVRVDSEPAAKPSSLLDGLDHDLDLHGVVLDAQGRALPGARLRVLFPTTRHAPGLGAALDEGRLVAILSSNAEGEFRISLTPGRVYDLEVHAPGHAHVKRLDLYAGEFVRVELPAAAFLTGRVSHGVDSAPVAAATLLLKAGILRHKGEAQYSATTDAAGEFRVDNLPSGVFELSVESREHPRFDQLAFLEAGKERRLDIQMETGAFIRGRVLDGEDGHPITGARVSTDSRMTQAAITGEDGSYVIANARVGGVVQLHADAAGYGKWEVNVSEVPRGGLEQDFHLLPGRRAHGRVVDHEGAAIEGARISAISRRRNKTDNRAGRSDEKGSFELEALRVDGRHTLMIRAEGFATAVYDFPHWELEWQSIDLGEIVLAPPCALSGVVLDSRGAALGDLWVLLDILNKDRDLLGPALEAKGEGYASSEGFGTGRVMAKTDERGRFFFEDLPAGDYGLSAGAKGWAQRANQRLELRVGEQRANIVLKMGIGLSIEGTLIDTGGHPLAGLGVHVWPSDPTARGAQSSVPITYNLTHGDGSFAVHGLQPGTYYVSVEGDDTWGQDGHPLESADSAFPGIAAGTSGLRLVVSNASFVEGRVEDSGGQPLPGCAVWIEQDGWLRGREITDSEGRFRLRCQEGSTLDIRAIPWAPGSEQGTGSLLRGVSAGSSGLVIELP